ncbi:MAG TPA: hypothetical protein VEZ55_03185 [Chitinophagaceae bacterium]|nr:hypothetical protein [Chitinophagaceae bacterium]
MQFNRTIACFFLCLLLHSIGDAQSILYSSTIGNDSYTNFQVIGKAGNFYWLYKSKKRGHTWPLKEDRSFEVYDDRLHRVKEINSSLSDSVVKQYLIPQKYSFDQLMFKQGLNKTSVVVNRFSQDGGEVKNAHLLDFPGEMALEDLLVSRSPDRTKILILAFVQTKGVTRNVYARVYTREWILLHETVHKEGKLLQPFIQYELTEHVLESSDASPVKVTNSGDWLMVAPARLKNSFILCHFKMEDSSFVQMDVGQPQGPGIEYCSLSVEEGKDAFVGVLENLSPSDKRVRIMRYSLSQDRLNFDTSYRFNVPNHYKRQGQYLFEEAFIQIPGKGFMYMKEYGRRYFIAYSGEQVMLDDEQEYAAYTTHAGRLKFNKEEYTRNIDLSQANKRFERGNLSVKYFPFQPTDTCWSGFIHVEQNTQSFYSSLSYACVPAGDKIVFLYNSLANNDHKLGSTTVLDHKGQLVNDGFIFWRSTNVLDFQNARLIQPAELYVPYERNGRQGFAIIRFKSS